MTNSKEYATSRIKYANYNNNTLTYNILYRLQKTQKQHLLIVSFTLTLPDGMKEEDVSTSAGMASGDGGTA